MIPMQTRRLAERLATLLATTGMGRTADALPIAATVEVLRRYGVVR